MANELFALLTEAKTVYLHDVVLGGKQYHRYIDCDHAACRNCHEMKDVYKRQYLFSCFCGLRISDIIKLKWVDVFVDRGQYRLAVSMKKTKEPIYLPLSPEALKWRCV